MNLRELAEAIDAELIGATGEEEVLGISGVENAASGQVTYAENERRLAEAETGPALAVIVTSGRRASSKPLLCAANPRLAFARALSTLYPLERMAPGVHPTACIAPSAELAEGVAVGPYAVIGEDVKIGPNAQIHAHVYLGHDAIIGADSILHPRVVICERVRIGARVVIQAGSVIGSTGFGYVWDGQKHVWLPHIGTVIIEDDVEVGANTTIDRGTTGETIVGRGTKIDNLVQVAHNVIIGKNCLLAGQVGISGSVKLSDGVVLAGQAGVSDHVQMGARAMGAAGSDIIRDVPAGEVVLGRPARRLNEQMRIDAAATRLPDMVRELRELRKRVEELEKKS